MYRKLIAAAAALMIAAVPTALPFAYQPQALAQVVSSGELVRLKDIAVIQGARKNQVTGMGLVVGLPQTGDTQQNRVTFQALENVIQRLNNIPINELRNAIRSRNAALVLVTAELPAFVKPGQTVDVTVASVGDARSITNGMLLAVPLKAADGRTYVVAQGPISTGGFQANSSGSSVQKNQVLVGRVPNGGIVEKDVPVTLVDQTGYIHFNLLNPDFATATRTADAINRSRLASAKAVDAGTVQVYVTGTYRERIPELIGRIEQLTVRPDHIAKVVIEERTGTIILGANTRIDPVALSHGSLVIKIDTRVNVSQPAPFGQGGTTVTTESRVDAVEQPAKTVTFGSGATMGQLVRALNALGVTPREMISIVQNLKAAGALNAHLEII